MESLVVEYLPVSSLLPYLGNAKSHSKSQIRQIARSITEFGFLVPILIDDSSSVIAGHGRLLAAQHLGLPNAPVLKLSHLTPAQVRAYRLADNKLAENSEWDTDLLKIELDFLMSADVHFDVDLTGFSVPELDVVLGAAPKEKPEDPLPPVPAPGDVVTRPGDLWALGKHRVLCGACRDSENVARLVGSEQARMILTDPPFNVAIEGHVSGLGQHQHSEFAMASGEMSPGQFVEFLKMSLGASVEACIDGALIYAFMDWAHLAELQQACSALQLKPINLCVWAKSNGGMGSLYRSAHELIWISKKGKAPHLNNVELGKHGRYRTNVWNYAGMNAFNAERDAALAAHPTVKPVALLADAIKDVTQHRDLVLDPFLGSGSTLIAAQKTNRRCFGIEYEPKYVDFTLRRWMELTGKDPILEQTGETFDDVMERRRATAATTEAA